MTSSVNPWRRRLKHLHIAMTSLAGHPRRSFRLQVWLAEMLRASKFCDGWGAQDKDRGKPTAPPIPGANDSRNPLWNYFASHTEGRGIIKIKHYFDIYQRHLSKFVGQSVHVVEIGVQSGGSLEMWRQYFGPQSHITGIDIREGCKCFEDSNTTIVIGDQADRSFWKKFREQSKPVDILIDDGGHQPEQQMVSLEETLPYLRPGGVYICEDISADTFRAFAYSLVEKLNDINYIPDSMLFSATPTEFQASINSIHFYPNMVVIEKNERLLERFLGLKQGTEWRSHKPS